jgi:hypothetical protein
MPCILNGVAGVWRPAPLGRGSAPGELGPVTLDPTSVDLVSKALVLGKNLALRRKVETEEVKDVKG